jgi:uncharacterized repeat protein (TIGR02543 family)
VVGELLTTPTSPTREGYNFVGWTKNLTTQEIFNFEEDTLTSDTTLYALWEVKPINNPYGYYDSITATGGASLVNQLSTLINVVKAGNGTQNTSYEQAKTILQQSDKDIDNPTMLWGMYNSQLLPIPWDHINNWNREHVWPQSLLGVEAKPSSRNVATDPHNLRAINPSVNSSRSNKYFDLITATSTYYPGDAHRGDIARILLYMTVRYDNLSLVDGVPSTYQMSRISLLLEWHNADPVDAFETQRNDIIFEWQGNRNPFIDNPDWFETVWNYYMQQAGLVAEQKAMQDYVIASMHIIQTRYIPLGQRKFVN